MKKKIFIIPYVILVLILISISRSVSSQELPTTNKQSFKQQIKKLSYYKKDNLSRYIKYQKQNPNLSSKQIVIDVNIGLDTPYYTNIKPSSNTNTILVLVNKYNYLKEDYIPTNLELIDEKYANSGMKLVKEAKDAFEQMASVAASENLNIIAMSTYRSYNYQKKLYNRYVNQDGKEKADTYSARPGHSEHQTGLAVDVYNKVLPYTNFEETKEFTWMQENAHKYGFILRYPKDKTKETGYQYESWHYRYVGLEIATYIYKNNITYDEYYIKYLDK